ncbi:MAG TPA: hypothetical protein VG204_23640 [Terriglobia bacterium]|nr:hypothetical protein [Terriglobia bacterium]
MKPVGIISTGVLFLLLGTVAPTYAQQEQHQQDAKPPKQEQQGKGQQGQQQKQAKGQQQRAQQQPQGQQQHVQQQPQGQNRPQPQRAQQQPQRQNRPQQPQRAQQQPQRQVNRPSRQARRVPPAEQRVVWQQHRARNWQSEHHTWQQRGGYNGYRIPEDRYRRYFGPNDAFRIYSYPVVVVGGYPRFQYGGFWFSLVDPWPEYWSDDWYDNDDVYIDYSGDGYYLYNRRYPRVRIAISVYVN